MKKISIVFFCFFMTVAVSCNNTKQIRPKSNEIINEYLNLLEVNGSKIFYIDDFEEKEYQYEAVPRSYKTVTESMEEVIKVYYIMTYSEKNTVSCGDIISVDYEYTDPNTEDLICEEGIQVPVGMGELAEETKLLFEGSRVNETVECTVSEYLADVLLFPETATIRITVDQILSFTPRDDEAVDEWLSNQGFDSFQSLFIYLLEKKIEEYDFEVYLKVKGNLFETIISKGQFSILEEDLEKYAFSIVRQYEDLSSMLGLSRKELCTSVLGLDNEDELYYYCAEKADKEIKRILSVGALADYYGIVISEEYWNDFCRINSIEQTDKQSVVSARYYCLEEAVTSYLLNTEDSRFKRISKGD